MLKSDWISASVLPEAIAQSHRGLTMTHLRCLGPLVAAFWSSLRISLNELARQKALIESLGVSKAASASPEPSLKFPLSEPRPIGWDRRCPSISKVKQKKHWLRTYVAKADDWSALIFHGFGWNPVPTTAGPACGSLFASCAICCH